MTIPIPTTATPTAKSLQSCPTLCDPSLGFSRQEHWSGLPLPSPVHKSEKWKWSRSVMSDSSRPRELQLTRLLRPWDFPGKSTGVGCHCLLQYQPLSFYNYFAMLTLVCICPFLHQSTLFLWSISKLQTSVNSLPNNSACDRPFNLSANMNLLCLQQLFYEKCCVILMKFSGSVFFYLMELRFLIFCLGPAKHCNISCNMKQTLSWQTSLPGPHEEWTRIG